MVIDPIVMLAVILILIVAGAMSVCAWAFLENRER
jgi:hypothetical protein